MRSRLQKRRMMQGEKGYALLLMMFFLGLVVVATMSLAPHLITQNQREKEDEMIWRGKQYARGVKLYFQKTHHFPASLDDLTKPKTGIRFMRKAYKDPMNSEDGSWRVVYVGAVGQLIGSLKNAAPIPLSIQPGNTVSNSIPSSVTGSNNSGNSVFSGAPAEPSPTPEPEERTNYYGVSGASIAGVGSKINKKSFQIYEKAKNYREFEFTWLPGQDLAGTLAGGASQGVGTPIGDSSDPSPISPTPRLPGQTGSPDSGPPPRTTPN